jgi:hypothetical protein
MQTAEMAAPVSRPRDVWTPWVLAQLAVQGRVRRAGNHGHEAVLPRRGAALSVGCPHKLHAQAEDQPIPVATKNVNPASGGAQGRTQVVIHADRGRKLDDAVHAAGRKHFGGGKDHGATSAVADQVDRAIGALLATRSHLDGEPVTLGTVMGVIVVVYEGAPAAVGPDKGLDL